MIESHHKKLGTKEKEIAWVLPAAELLFETACAYGWNIERGGVYYTFDNKGKVIEVSILSGPSMKHEWVKMSIVHTRPRQNEYLLHLGKVLDPNKYYWALAEMIAAAGLLGQRKGKAMYWEWYDKAWEYALKYFIDEERGGWYPMVNVENVRTDTHAGPNHIGPMVKCYPSKTDYHPLAACYEVLRAMGEEAIP